MHVSPASWCGSKQVVCILRREWHREKLQLDHSKTYIESVANSFPETEWRLPPDFMAESGYTWNETGSPHTSIVCKCSEHHPEFTISTVWNVECIDAVVQLNPMKEYIGGACCNNHTQLNHDESKFITSKKKQFTYRKLQNVLTSWCRAASLRLQAILPCECRKTILSSACRISGTIWRP